MATGTSTGSYAIDFNKIDQAFQHLADTPEGNAALDQLRKALDHIGSTVKPQLNGLELHYLHSNLVQQSQGGFGPGLIGSAARTAGSRVKSGFLIKLAVPD